MALVVADRVRETTSSTGTGAVTLAGAYAGFQSFSVLGNGNSTYYAISDPSTGEWEVGIGTYTLAGNTLSRDTVLASTNSGSLVNFAAGTKDAICTQPAERAVYVVGSSVVATNSATVPNSLLANSSVTLGSTSVSLGATASTLAGLTSVAATNFTGAFDGVLGGVTPAAATVTTLGATTINATTINTTTLDLTNLEVTNIKAKDGTASATIADTTGVMTIASAVLTTADINGGTLDGTTIGGAVAGAGTFSSLVATTADINGGTLDGVTIGASSAAAATVTTLTATADSAFTSTGALQISAGTTAQRPTGAVGKIRWNSTLSQYEGYDGSNWTLLGGAVVSNDTATSSNLYPLFSTTTTGNASTLYTSNAQYLFKPSTGELSVKAPRASNGIVVNSATVTENYTIASGDNGMSAGPITVDSGVAVTVSSGSVWTVV